MCDFSPSIPKMAAPPPPPAPKGAPVLADPFSAAANQLDPNGQPIRASQAGLSSLRIDRPDSNGLNILR